MTFVDIHTHKKNVETDVVSVYNVSPEDAAQHTVTAGGVLFSAGVHPWDIENTTEKSLDVLREISSHARLKLIGECGLDKNIGTDYDTQLYFFREQIRISEKAGKPLIVHCVGSFNELFQLRCQLQPARRWILHGFRGKPQLAAQALRAGCDLSFGEKFNPESVRITPFENLFIETDQSQLPVIELYKSIAEIKNSTMDKLNAGFNLILE